MNSSTLADYISALGLDVNYSQKNLNLYLDVSANFFAENSDFNSLKIEPGVEFLKYLKGRNYLYLNIGYSVLNYRELFTDFNYRGPTVEAGVKYYIKPSLLLKTGYYYQYRDYPNYSSFDFHNHAYFIELNQFFSTQTTIRLESGFNFRFYPHVAISDSSGTMNETGTSFPGGNGWGGGKNNNPDPGNQNSGYNTIKVPNIYGQLKVAQGIGTRIGLTGEIEMRKNFQGLEEADSLIENSYIIYPYNDDYLWDGSRYSIAVNFIPFYEIAFQVRASYLDKNYPGIFVMDTEGVVIEPNIERADQLVQFQLNISKKFKKFDLYINALHRDNRSNDDFFLYKMWTVSAGVDLYF